MINWLYKHRYLVLLLITLFAFVLRFYRLDASGLSEDETNKMAAVISYQQGIYAVNAEHPMLMKLMVTGSVIATEYLHLPFTTETALRLPNVIFGSLTCLILYLFFSDMFGFRVGLVTALIWAINIHAILINRVAKEDTLLVFFLWLAYYFCRRAKRAPEAEDTTKRWFYGLSGISFGLMLASKYFPHYFGLNFLYYHIIGPNKWNSKIKTPYLLILFASMLAVFFIANPVVLMPSTLKYMSDYAHLQTLTHHGYWMMGQLYHNEPSSPVDSTPFYFYLLALVVKTPIPLLLAFLVGIVEIFTRKNDDNYFFLRFMLIVWLVPYSLFGAKWLRYMLSFIPLVCVVAAIGLVVGYDYLRKWLSQYQLGEPTLGMRLILASLGGLIFIGIPTINTIQVAPFYSLYVSPLAGGASHTGYFFPHDEFYDLGLREAIQYIAQDAEPAAIIANETPGVIEHYRNTFKRPDLRSVAMSDPQFRFADNVPTYVVVQDGRRYFENEQAIAFVEANYLPIKEVRVRGASAVRIYRIFGREENSQARHRASATLIIQ